MIVAARGAGMLAGPIAMLSLLAIATVAAAPAAAATIAAQRAQCYEPCAARCASRYACEYRNAGPNCFTNLNKCRSFCWRTCRAK
jgi:hypothetical protein